MKCPFAFRFTFDPLWVGLDGLFKEGAFLEKPVQRKRDVCTAVLVDAALLQLLLIYFIVYVVFFLLHSMLELKRSHPHFFVLRFPGNERQRFQLFSCSDFELQCASEGVGGAGRRAGFCFCLVHAKAGVQV